MLRKILLFVGLLIVAYSLKAQSITNNNIRTIDSILKVNNLTFNDFWMPNDVVDEDKLRLKIINEFFSNPSKAVSFVDTYKQFAERISYKIPIEFFNVIIDDYNLKPIQIVEFNNNLPYKYINEYYGINIDSVSNIITGLFAKQYIGAIAQYITMAENDDWLNDNDDYKFLINNLDSLFFIIEKAKDKDSYDSYFKNKLEANKYRTLLSIGTKFNKSKSFSFSYSLYNYLNYLKQLANKNYDLLKDSLKSVEFTTPYGKIAIGGTEDNIYIGDYLMIVDIGGNDKYFLSNVSKRQISKTPSRFIIDYTGNDIYYAKDFSLGGAFLGTNILIDYSGDDSYNAGNLSLGSAIFGTGILHDLSGNDIYRGAQFTQGAATFGIGLLIDENGNDEYYSEAFSQGFGGTKGFGMLLDKNGNDKYNSGINSKNIQTSSTYTQGAATGFNDYISGGMGFLFDLKGNDLYKSEGRSQSSANWFSVAALIDDEGDDKYYAGSLSQSSASNYSFSVLIDKSGNDVLLSNFHSLAASVNYSSSWVLNDSGNDKYYSGVLSFGSAQNGANAIFADFNGNDVYSVPERNLSFGYVDTNFAYSMPALFFDRIGNDVYSDFLDNSSIIKKGNEGYFIDSKNDEEPEKSPAKEIAQIATSTQNIDSLYIEAIGFGSLRQYSNSAKQKIASLKDAAIKYLDKKIEKAKNYELKAIKDIYNSIKLIDSVYITKATKELLLSDNRKKICLGLDIIADNRIIGLSKHTADLAESNDWMIRTRAINALGEMLASPYMKLLENKLKDPNPVVAAKAVEAIVRIFPDSVFDIIKIPLNDERLMVRNAAIKSFEKYKRESPELLFALLNAECDKDFKLQQLDLYLNIDMDKDQAKRFTKTILSLDQEMREEIYNRLLETQPEYWKFMKKDIIKGEKQSDLKNLFKKGKKNA